MESDNHEFNGGKYALAVYVMLEVYGFLWLSNFSIISSSSNICQVLLQYVQQISHADTIHWDGVNRRKMVRTLNE